MKNRNTVKGKQRESGEKKSNHAYINRDTFYCFQFKKIPFPCMMMIRHKL